MSEELEFQNFLLRHVSSQINTRRPELSHGVILILSQVGLAAETDHRLNQSEKDLLSSALDTFESKIFEMTFQSQEKEKGFQSLMWFYKSCSNRRILHGYKTLISMVMKKDQPVESPKSLQLISLVFQRLRGLNWMQGLKSKVSPLGGKILHKIETQLDKPKFEQEEEQCLVLIQTASSVIRSIGSSAKPVSSLTQIALRKMEAIETTNPIRLESSKLLALIISGKKDHKQHGMLMMQSLLSFLYEIAHLILGPYEESTEEMKPVNSSIEASEYSLNLTTSKLDSIASITKVFAGGFDLLERLLTTPSGDFCLPNLQVLKLLVRIICLNASQLKGKIGSPHSFELLSVLPGMQIMTWRILHQLFLVSGKALLQQYRLVTQLLNNSLQDTCNLKSAVAAAVYKTVQTYLTVAGFAGVLDVYKSTVQALEAEFQDNNCEKSVGMSSSKEQKIHRRKRKKQEELQSAALDVEYLLSEPNSADSGVYGNPLHRQSAQQGVLILVGELLKTGSHCIPLEESEKLEEKIGQLCWKCWNRTEVQIEIFQLLLVSILTTTRYRSRLLSMGVWIFQKGLHSKQESIEHFCQEALSKLDLLMHPRSLSLTIPAVQLISENSGFPSPKSPPRVSSAEESPEKKTWTEEDPAEMELDSENSLPEIDSGSSEE